MLHFAYPFVRCCEVKGFGIKLFPEPIDEMLAVGVFRVSHRLYQIFVSGNPAAVFRRTSTISKQTNSHPFAVGFRRGDGLDGDEVFSGITKIINIEKLFAFFF
jgi:hypothetical protein